MPQSRNEIQDRKDESGIREPDVLDLKTGECEEAGEGFDELLKTGGEILGAGK